MLYGLFIQDAPTASEAFHGAARFASALVQRGHLVRQIFLYEDAVLAAAQALPSGLKGLDALMTVAQAHGIPVLACQAAIDRLGITFAAGTTIKAGSLGQWFDALHELDRVQGFA